MNRTLRDLSAAPTPALPHGGGRILVVAAKTVVGIHHLSFAIRPPLFVAIADRLPPPRGRGGIPHEKGRRLFHGNPGWGQQTPRAAATLIF